MTRASETPDFAAIQARIAAIKADPRRHELVREREEAAARMERERQAQAVAKAQALSIVGERFAGRTFASLHIGLANGKAAQNARAIAADPRRGGAFWGSPGTGKTHLAGAIAHACIERGIATIMESSSALLRRIRSTYDGAAKVTEEEMLERIASVPVLIVDDFGKERLTDWSASMLWEIANARYERALPMVLTANSSFAALSARYSQPIKGVEEHTLPAMMRRIGEMTGPWIEVRAEARRFGGIG